MRVAPAGAWGASDATYQSSGSVMAMTTRSASSAVLLLTPLALAATPAQASLFKLAASGTISENSTGDATIPIGTSWSFDLTYDTAAPDLASADPTFGSFTNTAAPPALTSFHFSSGELPGHDR